ncbi:hypothetical protein [Actinokineospora sp. HUAS TT18]|uniref:hypothetical protein n=1 Tax=Actinokineospora sp. HUAS TT18 TaxID=3447451 RepID=UPI003F5264BC
MIPSRVNRPRAYRAWRGVLLGSTSASLAIAAHGMAGGGVPDAAIVVVLTGLVAWVGTALANKARAKFALLGVSQASLHILLTYVTPGHSTTSATAAMIATHLAATALTAVLLTRADAALDVIAAAVAGIVRALLWTPEPPKATVEVHREYPSFRRFVFQTSQPRRGPPRFS